MHLAKLKKLTTATLVILTLFNCGNQEQEKGSVNKEQKNDWMEDGLKGKVKIFTQVYYEAIDHFGKIEKGERAGSFFDNLQMIYDKKGNKIEVNEYDAYEGNLLWKYTYKYDEKGNKIEFIVFDSDDSLDEKYTYKYDEKGDQIELIGYDSDGNFIGKHTYKYDEKGNKIETNYYNSDNSLEYKHTYKYDEKGNQIETNLYNSDGSLDNKATYKATYKYDEEGNKIEENWCDSDGNPSNKYTFQYEYDEYNNWTKKIEFKNEFPKTIAERKYQYYE